MKSATVARRDAGRRCPAAIHDWMPRLAEEERRGSGRHLRLSRSGPGDLLRYSRVEKASGEPVTLKEYLEQAGWRAVAKESPLP